MRENGTWLAASSAWRVVVIVLSSVGTTGMRGAEGVSVWEDESCEVAASTSKALGCSATDDGCSGVI